MVRFFIFAFVVFGSFSATAQFQVQQYAVSSGLVVKNWLVDYFPERKPALLFSAYFARQTNGSQYWHHRWNYPTIGLNVWTGGVGNPQELGYTIGAVPTLTFGSGKNKGKIQIQLGMGPTWYSKPYDGITNPTNIMVGSQFSTLNYAILSYDLKISNQTYLNTGVGVLHSSNAHVQIPNVGLNMPFVRIGITIKPDSFQISTPPPGQQVHNKWYFNARFGVGLHEFAETTEPVGTPKYAIYTASVFAGRTLGAISVLQMGFHAKYYNSFAVNNQWLNLFPNPNFTDFSVFSVFLGHELHLGKMSLVTQGAIDLHNPFYIRYDDATGREKDLFRFLETWLSSRLGLQYHFSDPILSTGSIPFVGIFVNANFGEADFAEATIGLRF